MNSRFSEPAPTGTQTGALQRSGPRTTDLLYEGSGEGWFYVGRVSAPNNQLSVFSKVPSDSSRYLLPIFAGVLAFLTLTLATLFVVKAHPGLRTGIDGHLYAAASIVLAGYLAFDLARRIEKRLPDCGYERDLRRLVRPAADSRRRNPDPASGLQAVASVESESPVFHVGISYCEGVWSCHGDTAWDRGFLSIESDTLRFKGYGPGFALPLDRILDLGVRWKRGLRPGPLVAVRWVDAAGEQSVFCLESRKRLPREAIQETGQLLDWLRTARKGRPHAGPFVSFVEPFRSSRLDFCHKPAQAVTRRDRAVAAALSLGGAALIASLFWMMGRAVGLDFGALASCYALLCSTSFYERIIMARVRSRG